METSDLANHLIDALDDVLSSPRDVIALAITTICAGGHLLLEDVPGVGKTTMAKGLAKAISGKVSRIQFTPDMLPSDLTGVSVYDQRSQEFAFRQGPLFANIVIADEVNRANPKTQSAMLEAMGEGHVSVDGNTYSLPDPFFVVATQNPIELEGTYPLPEAQLDRFTACTSLGYPPADVETRAIAQAAGTDPLGGFEALCTLQDVLHLKASAGRVFISEAVAAYIVAILHATRTDESVTFGASPRAGFALAAMAKAWAMLQGRDFVIADDVIALAKPVLAHRLVLRESRFNTSMGSRYDVLDRVLEGITVPRASQESASRSSSPGWLNRAR
ncbi:MAG: AAA family ATPase [Bifidobacterium psychraerophilum]